MNPRDHHDDHATPRQPGDDDALRLQLRGLRRDVAPGADLWPGIAARIAQPQAAHAAPVARLQPRSRAVRFAPWALAASLVLAVGVAWQQRPAIEAPAPVAQAAPQMQLLPRAADAMAREYEAALRELQAGGRPVASDTALHELDRSARQIRTALARDPQSRLLFQQLRSTYEKRLQLTQRAALS